MRKWKKKASCRKTLSTYYHFFFKKEKTITSVSWITARSFFARCTGSPWRTIFPGRTIVARWSCKSLRSYRARFLAWCTIKTIFTRRPRIAVSSGVTFGSWIARISGISRFPLGSSRANRSSWA